MKIWIRSGALLFVSLAASGLAIAQAQPPVAISLCDLKKDPKTYDGKQIRVRGKINLEFEDFTFYDLSCNDDSPEVWLMFGGDVATPITSMWGDTRRPAGKNMTLYGKEFPLIQDASFDDFVRHVTAREKKRPVYRVTATLAGTFFAENPTQNTQLIRDLPGFGHMGCCRLLIINQISEVESVSISEADYNEKWTKRRH